MASSSPTAAEASVPATQSLPKVSVIVPIYNGAADIPDLAACLLAQTFPPDQVEYLLVDNNSRDRTSSLLKDWVKTASNQGLTWQYLSEADIQSSYAARNRGIRAARGELLAFTDADCRPNHDWLEKLIAPFDDPAVGLVIGEIAALPGDSWLEHYANQRNMMTQRFTMAHEFYPYGQTANLAVRRQALAGVGLFRPYLTTGGDADLCWRIQQQHPWQVIFAEDAIIQHRHRSTLKELASQWRRYGRSNNYLHELHGVRLRRNLNRKDTAHRIGRWALKEFPKAGFRLIQGKAAPVELVAPLLDLYCAKARETGQRQAQMPKEAREIEPFRVGEKGEERGQASENVRGSG
ncbi:MAG: glycosyltransferase [Cyanobacteria bacterium P01_A01_bin.123]